MKKDFDFFTYELFQLRCDAFILVFPRWYFRQQPGTFQWVTSLVVKSEVGVGGDDCAYGRRAAARRERLPRLPHYPPAGEMSTCWPHPGGAAAGGARRRWEEQVTFTFTVNVKVHYHYYLTLLLYIDTLFNSTHNLEVFSWSLSYALIPSVLLFILCFIMVNCVPFKHFIVLLLCPFYSIFFHL